MFKGLVRVAFLSIPLTLPVAGQVVYAQQGTKLVGSGYVKGYGGVLQGNSVALSADGNTALIGAPADNTPAGAAWIFTRSLGVWTQQGGKLTSGTPYGEAFGRSVALSGDGNTALIGEPYNSGNPAGAAWVFTRSNGVWTQPGIELTGSGEVGASQFGAAVALSADGNTAVIGGPTDNNYAGAIWLFTRSNGVWTQQGNKLVAAGSGLGQFLALSADGSEVLAPYGILRAGVFELSGGIWGSLGTIWTGSPVGPVALSSDGKMALLGEPSTAVAYTEQEVWQGGTSIDGGSSVALSANGLMAFSGAAGDSGGVGAVWIGSVDNNGNLHSAGKLTGSGENGAGAFGTSVAVSSDGSTVLVGGPSDNGIGAAWVFAGVTPVLVLGTSSMVLGSAGGSASIMATMNPPGGGLELFVNTSPSWIHLASSTGTGGAWILFPFTYDANAGPTRTGTISFNNGAATLTVTQSGSTYVPASQMTTLISSGLTDPSGVAVDTSGNVYIADSSTVKKWTLGTQALTILDSSSGLTASGVAVDAAGNVYIADATNSAIKKWAPLTQQETTLVSSGLNAPSGVAVDVSGNVYIADTGNHAVEEWAIGTHQVTSLATGGLSPRGVAVDVATNVYVADGNNTIEEWPVNTQLVTTLVSSGLNVPGGVAADGFGNFYIADTQNNAIKKWSANTQSVTPLVGSGLNQPNGVAVDAWGNVYIADTGNKAVKVLWNAYLDPSPIALPAASGSWFLPAVLPLTTPLNAQSDQAWLSITSQLNGLISYSYTANSGSSRTAHINVLGLSITVTQTGVVIPPAPALTISKTHSGSFEQNQQNATYTVTVSNAANAGPTNGMVTVAETVPSGLTLQSMAGSGWTCPGTAPNNCTTNNVLNAGASYPPITVTVNVASNASSPQVNAVSVSGGGSAIANATDTTTISTATYVTCVRDFRGMERSDALIYDPVGGTAYTALSNGNGTYQYVYNLFTPAFDTLRTGDFTGNGKADLVLYNSHTALAYIGMSNGDGTFAFQSLFWSPGYDFVEAGDLNGDGMTDFALYNSTTGTLYTGISNGNGTFTYKYTLISTGYTFLRLADFTGDGKADLFVYDATTGAAYLGVGDGTGGFAFNPLSISPGYDRADVGDLNGDGKADLILYNSSNGNTATGISNGAGGFTFTPLIFSPGFTSVRLADYTGDGKADVTVYNKTTAAAYFGAGTGLGTFNFQSLFWSPGYDAVEPQDVNGDGKIDVVLYNSTTGTEYTGISNGDGTFTYTYSYWGTGKVLAR